jgi:uncharacterized membrane-anchored protein
MHRRLLLPGVALLAFASPAFAQNDPPKPAETDAAEAQFEDFRQRLKALDPKIEWQEGPCTGEIGDVATIRVPVGAAFTDKPGTRRFIVALKNLPGDQIATAQWMRPPYWAAYFAYDGQGHIKDEDKGELKADALLKALQEGCRNANVERRKRGIEEFEIAGWAVPPHYDEATHNLEWGTRLHSANSPDVINYEIRLLSRLGYVSSLLVCSPEDLDAALPQFRALLAALDFNSGQHYDEVKPGDPIAEMTLTTLIVGGAAALGWKAGLFKYLWKIVIAVAAGIAALWRKLTGRGGRAPKPVT